MTTLSVLGDSVPNGYGADAPAWPRRVPDLVGASDATVASHGDVGTTLAGLADAAPEVAADADGAPLVVLVHAGHNDAQLSGGDPRVTVERFRTAAASLDRALADADAVDRHAFVGLVPLLDVGGVSLSDAQPGRALRYDAALAEAVDTHLPVAEPVDEWGERTVDGVHPDAAGHEYIARRVADWLDAPA